MYLEKKSTKLLTFWSDKKYFVQRFELVSKEQTLFKISFHLTKFMYFQIPKAEQEWLTVAKQYQALWNFPHTVGDIDGKHVALQCPRNSASEYFNYKNAFSIVLFALVDANYNFMFVDVGCQGRMSDSGVFTNTELYKKLETKTLSLPQPVPLNGREKSVPYFFIGDEAFPLSESMNFQLHYLQSTKSCRKCIWPLVISVPSAS